MALHLVSQRCCRQAVTPAHCFRFTRGRACTLVTALLHVCQQPFYALQALTGGRIGPLPDRARLVCQPAALLRLPLLPHPVTRDSVLNVCLSVPVLLATS